MKNKYLFYVIGQYEKGYAGVHFLDSNDIKKPINLTWTRVAYNNKEEAISSRYYISKTFKIYDQYLNSYDIYDIAYLVDESMYISLDLILHELHNNNHWNIYIRDQNLGKVINNEE